MCVCVWSNNQMSHTTITIDKKDNWWGGGVSNNQMSHTKITIDKKDHICSNNQMSHTTITTDKKDNWLGGGGGFLITKCPILK